MKKWKIYATISLVLLLISYWCASVLEGVTGPTSTEIWFGAASLFTGVGALFSGITAVTEWDWGR
jgi:hypothetical protein